MLVEKKIQTEWFLAIRALVLELESVPAPALVLGSVLESVQRNQQELNLQ